MTILSFLKY